MAPLDSATIARQDALVIRLRNGDPEALRELMEIYYVPLVNFAAPYVDTIDAAEDAVQSVLIRLWERRADIPESGVFRAYLYSAVHKRAVSLYRQQATARRYHEKIVGETLQTRAYDENNGAVQLELDDLATQVNREIDSLPPKCREVFRLSRDQRLSYQEIAEVLGISVSTVRMQIIKALSVLRRDLEHWGRGDG